MSVNLRYAQKLCTVLFPDRALHHVQDCRCLPGQKRISYALHLAREPKSKAFGDKLAPHLLDICRAVLVPIAGVRRLFSMKNQSFQVLSLCGSALLALCLVQGCGRKVAVNKPPKGAYFKTHFQDESQFIVEAIVTDLAEMVYYAKSKAVPQNLSVSALETKGTAFRKPVYQVNVDFGEKIAPVSVLVKIDRPIWEPGVYSELAAALAKAVGLPNSSTPSSDPSGLKLIEDLKTLTALKIERANQNLSRALEADFQNPALHEQAAFLLGCFTFRDFSDYFYEIRSPLSRMTAHLAMARLLSGQTPYGVAGRTAEALLYTLMNNQTEALAKLSRLAQESPQIQPWIRALRARNTRDYRLLVLNTNSPLVEVVSWAAAYSSFVDSDRALEKAWEIAGPTHADFCRIVNGGHYRVEVGHELLRKSIPLEMQEIEEVYTLASGNPLTKANLVHELNHMPERCFSETKHGSSVRVIGWGQWALFLQKHLCHAIHHNFDFMNNKWGVPEDAKEFAAKCETMFSDLRLFPFARRLLCTESKDYHRALDDGFLVTVKTPQIVPAQMWNHLCYTGPHGELYKPNPNPHVNEWHFHNPPPGTAYNIDPRRNHPSITTKPGAVSQIEEMHASAPYDSDLSFFLLEQKFRNSETYDQAEEVYRPIADYSTRAMDHLAVRAKNKPEVYEKISLRAASLDPNRYFALGQYFATLDEQKAVRYFEKGLELPSDAVVKASIAPWLIKYYLQHEQRRKASDLADFAEEVYSEAGLRAKAEYLELVGRLKEALDVYLKIQERYQKCRELPAFAYRHRDKKTLGTEKYWKAEVPRLFPDGLKNTNLEELNGRPMDGVILQGQSSAARAAGLDKGDIIVAVDGIRIHNIRQCVFAQSLRLDPDMEFIAWKSNHYENLKARLLDRRLNSDIHDYPLRQK